jgi:hypothetical protein
MGWFNSVFGGTDTGCRGSSADKAAGLLWAVLTHAPRA